jgi:hypothetical protein
MFPISTLFKHVYELVVVVAFVVTNESALDCHLSIHRCDRRKFDEAPVSVEINMDGSFLARHYL